MELWCPCPSQRITTRLSSQILGYYVEDWHFWLSGGVKACIGLITLLSMQGVVCQNVISCSVYFPRSRGHNIDLTNRSAITYAMGWPI